VHRHIHKTIVEGRYAGRLKNRPECLGIGFLKSLFSADCLGSRGLIHQIAALESLSRWWAPVMIASEVAAFAGHGVPSGMVYRQAPRFRSSPIHVI
jgi:hypothetical protein